MEVTCKDIFHELLGEIDDMMREKDQPPLLCSVYEQQFERTPPKVCERVLNIDSNLGRYVEIKSFIIPSFHNISVSIQHELVDFIYDHL